MKERRVSFHFDERSLVPLSQLEAQGQKFEEIKLPDKTIVIPKVARERSLICPAWEVQAYLAGIKSQFRRVVKFRKPFDHSSAWKACYPHPRGGWIFTDQALPEGMVGQWLAKMSDGREGKASPYQPGDRLIVRESMSLHHYFGFPLGETPQRYEGGQRIWSYTADGIDLDAVTSRRSPATMPRWASRITLEVERVRVQHLQDISEKDAEAEGVPRQSTNPYPKELIVFPPRVEFRMLWDRDHARSGHIWDVNDWVFAYDVKVVKP